MKIGVHSQPLKICRIATTPFFLRHHLLSTLLAIIQEGHELTVICSDGPEIQDLKKIIGLKIKIIEIRREISPIFDIISLAKLAFFFRIERFDIVHSCTPKAGILTAIAGILAGIKIRMHSFTGQAWVLRSSIVRIVSKWCDRIIANINTISYADSQSQVDFLIAEKICTPHQVKVLGAGSLSGVDLDHFNPNAFSEERKVDLRKALHIPLESCVINFTGRVNMDKGFREYVEAFKKLIEVHSDVYWIIVGPFENNQGRLDPNLLSYLKQCKNVRRIGYSRDTAPYFAISDIFCLPSYREGFGLVAIEAAAMKLPTIGTDIVGLRDAIVDKVTGILVPVNEVQKLYEALKVLYQNRRYREKLGCQGRIYAEQYFSHTYVNKIILNEYYTWSPR